MRTKEEKNAQSKQYYQKNKERIKLKYNKEHKSEYNKQYHVENSETLKLNSKEYYIQNVEEAKAKAREYYKLNKERAKENMKAYREANKDSIKQRQKAWSDANKDILKSRRYVKAYGITLEQYNKMLAEQNGKCKICGIHHTELPINQVLGIDHCHRSGAVRGLLCNRCNNILGFADDNIEIFNQCIEYLS